MRGARAEGGSAVTDGAVSRRPEGWQPPLPQWSNAQISEHYSTCIKLCTENVSPGRRVWAGRDLKSPGSAARAGLETLRALAAGSFPESRDGAGEGTMKGCLVPAPCSSGVIPQRVGCVRTVLEYRWAIRRKFLGRDTLMSSRSFPTGITPSPCCVQGCPSPAAGPC